MVGAINFIKDWKLVCRNNGELCINCPIGDICFINNFDADDNEIVAKVTAEAGRIRNEQKKK